MGIRDSINYRESVVLGCAGCFFFDTRKLLQGVNPCTRKGKREVGKLGKYLNKKKALKG